MKYANIDFANVGVAEIGEFLSKSGIIGDLVVSDSRVTGTLVGVTIKGDLIEGGTIVADKLIIQGEDGLYYRLNTDGETIETEQTEYNSINGAIIVAQSITASKIAVDDLVAFDATIGGFVITDTAIRSYAKDDVGNTTRGIYLDNDGQIAFGDGSNFIKFFTDQNGDYQLAISANSLKFAASGMSVEDGIVNAQTAAGDAMDTSADVSERLGVAESSITQLSNRIEMLVTDENGASLMTQTENGWTFSMGSFQSDVKTLSDSLSTIEDNYGGIDGKVNDLSKDVEALNETAEYVRIGKSNDKPCIELGESDSDFKVQITNKEIMFMDGKDVPTYINTTGLVTENITVDNELRHGEWVWKRRDNGNLGLTWKEVTE